MRWKGPSNARVQVYELVKAVTDAEKAVREGPTTSCEDEHTLCESWAKAGECDKNPTYMEVNCKASCKRCKKAEGAPKKEAPKQKAPLNNQGVGKVEEAR